MRAVTTIRSDVSEIRSSLKRQAATVQTPTTTALSDHSSLPSSASIASNVNAGQSISVTPMTDFPVTTNTITNEPRSFADCVKIKGSDVSFGKPKSKPIIGKAQGKKLVCVTRKKNIDLFVSRLEPSTLPDEVHASVIEVFQNDDGAHIAATDVKCIKLDTKYEGYASFRVTVVVASNMFEHVLDVLSSVDTWPEGALIRKFYNQKLHE